MNRLFDSAVSGVTVLVLDVVVILAVLTESSAVTVSSRSGVVSAAPVNMVVIAGSVIVTVSDRIVVVFLAVVSVSVATLGGISDLVSGAEIGRAVCRAGSDIVTVSVM